MDKVIVKERNNFIEVIVFSHSHLEGRAAIRMAIDCLEDYEERVGG